MDTLLLGFADVSALIGFSRATIENWAYRRKPAPSGFPSPYKIGRILKYRREEIVSWVDALPNGRLASSSNISRRLVAGPEGVHARLRGRPRKIATGIAGVCHE